ncbi:MAG: hypothetical protein JJ916_07585 [Phycisphaerales bacterium]|nr:hypothetical protein [Phycisphaerales bacterium]
MQQNIVEPNTLPELPQPGPFEHWVYEQPLAPAIALIVAGILTMVLMRYRKNFNRVGLPVGVLLIALGSGVYTLGTLTVTEREHLQARSDALVQSVANAQPDELRSMLDPDVRLSSVFASAEGADRIVQIATTRNQGVVQSADVGKVHAGLYSDRVATTQIRVRTEGSFVPSLSWWRVDWERVDTQSPWLVTHIEPIWVQGISNPAGSN